MNVADPLRRLYINVRTKCIACLTSNIIVDFAEVVYRQIPSLTLRHHLCLYTNKPWVLQGITQVDNFILFVFVGSIVLGGGNPNNTARIIWDVGQKQHRQEGIYYDIIYLSAYKYCLCQRLTSVRNGLWKKNDNKQFVFGRNGSSEVLYIVD